MSSLRLPVLAALGLTVLAGCSSGHGLASPSVTPVSQVVNARVGAITISGAYIPAQASPDVAAAYFTVANSGSTPDTLTSVTTSAAASVQLHETVTDGGAETMEPLGSLLVPAHGSAAFSSGHKHLMLMRPSRKLTEGEQVTMTLHFIHAGAITMTVPVVSMTGASSDDMGDMTMPAGS